MKHLFRISHKILDSFEIDDVSKTYNDMKELNIANPPYEKFAIEVSSKFYLKFGNKIHNIQYGHDFEDQDEKMSLLFEFDGEHDEIYAIYNGKKKHADEILKNALIVEGQDYAQEFANSFSATRDFAYKFLIVLLATKNKAVNEKIDKDLARGRYNKKQEYRKDYPITTTISIGKITETYKSEHGGGTTRPHLRRGHIRTQHYGPKNEMTKKIFIQPVFVNADEGWIAQSKTYNVV